MYIILLVIVILLLFSYYSCIALNGCDLNFKSLDNTIKLIIYLPLFISLIICYIWASFYGANILIENLENFRVSSEAFIPIKVMFVTICLFFVILICGSVFVLDV